MPTFMISIKDNKKLHGKISLCINIYFKLMDVWCYPIAINLTEQVAPKTKFLCLNTVFSIALFKGRIKNPPI